MGSSLACRLSQLASLRLGYRGHVEFEGKVIQDPGPRLAASKPNLRGIAGSRAQDDLQARYPWCAANGTQGVSNIHGGSMQGDTPLLSLSYGLGESDFRHFDFQSLWIGAPCDETLSCALLPVCRSDTCRIMRNSPLIIG